MDSPIPTGQSPMSDTPYMPSLSQLREMLRNAPDVSQERINEIRRKLQSGAYLTRAAAEETAGRMLDSGDFPEQA